ncbi:MAG: LPS export ABC transporter permease LptG [Polaromonas sp. 39-63-203]|jgi:lipopolysaccharide export system permease protein|uniref:LPS export ABC transporter permease LptG n=1 Tax=Polaromonas sp. TaxID=1869339 RepID=UPI000BD8DAEC|nr:LPS export ABC transporter permease LptG [Polaromonas sp.]OYY52675.1 MAG: LPS export ABC transporter permease LptG [Polaromonas sp. 35-63-240]OYZ83889.1 MAG: LPS export ABC transporter permease LptG [Polaromonas sp. 24-62-144]OZA98531.1 MAG: LPS export ABC transporter permease LptG [Polaromonas sp. 39-63-203]HQS32753.1 LPS export ABC transporter permease LptG [Polaromonas sp.]HQS91936.1 LPS export ABC transporter permease LptG [Polaromonas sp.]
MKTIRRLIYGEVLLAIALVALGFLALFLFFDLVDELQHLGRRSSLEATANIYQIRHALLYVALLVPNHLYELLPISVLIGTIFVMARLAQSSEYTILRTSGLGPWRALRLLLGLGAFFVLLSFAVGDYLAPASDRAAQLLKARYQNRITVGQTGAWLKEKQTYNNYVVNVKALTPENKMRGVRIFEFNNQGQIVSTTEAPQATFGEGDAWVLSQVTREEFPQTGDAGARGKGTPQDNNPRITRQTLPSYQWRSGISAEMVAVALLKPERMATIDLFNYVRHLDANGQTAQRYEIEFWKKVFYPLSCLVMVMLALPFAYLHFRSGGIAGYVFAGVMIGISFFLLNNVFGYIGNLRNWQPWLAAAAPGLLYMTVSLGAFGWLVVKR